MKRTVNIKKIITSMAIAIIGLPLLGFGVTSLVEYTSKEHCSPVTVDDNYSRVFKGTRALKENQYSNQDFTYSANLTYVTRTNADSGDLEAAVSLGTATDTAIMIPKEYSDGTNTYSVVAIDYSGFANYEDLKSVTFEDSSLIYLMDSQAFASCPNMTTFNSTTEGECIIPANLTYVSTACFMNDYSLTSLSFAGAKVTAINDNAFNGCKSFAKNIVFNITSSLTIGDSAFANCTSLPNIILPDGVTSIGDYCFFNCTSIQRIFIPSTCNTVGSYAFRLDTSATAYIGKTVAYPDGWARDSARVDFTAYTSGTVEDWNYADNKTMIPVKVGYATISIDPDNNYIYSSTWDSTNSIFRITIVQYIGKGGVVEVPQTLPITGSNSYTTALVNSSSQKIGVVTEIATGAFSNLKTITSLTLPNTVEYIDASSINGCGSKLTSLTLGDKNEANEENATYPNGDVFTLYGNASATTYAMSTYGLVGLQTIGSSAFSTSLNNSVFTTLSIPSTTVTVGYNAMSGATYCTSFTINGADDGTSKLQAINQSAFYSIGNYAGANIDLVIPGTVTSIGSYAFSNTTGIKSVYFEDRPVAGTANCVIAGSAFSSDTKIQYVKLGNNVKTINSGAFTGDTSIDWVYFPSSVTTSTGAFVSTTNYITYYFESSAAPTGFSNAMSGTNTIFNLNGGSYYSYYNNVYLNTQNCVYNVKGYLTVDAAATTTTFNNVTDGSLVTDTYLGIQYTYSTSTTGSCITNYLDYIGKTSVDVTSTNYKIKSVGDRAFLAITALTSIYLPDDVTSIGAYAFCKCTKLTSVGTSSTNDHTLPSSITTIGDYAFAKTGITSVTIGKNVSSLGTWAFFYSPSMTSLTIDSANTKYLSDSNNCAVYTINGTNDYTLQYITGTSIAVYTILSGTKTISGFSMATTKVTGLIIPTTVTTISDYGLTGLATSAYGVNDTFSDFPCTIESITFADSTKSMLSYIGYYGMGRQTAIDTTISLPNNSSVKLLYIKSYAFRFDKKLPSVVFPDNGTTNVDNEAKDTDGYYTLASYMFDQCDALNKIKIPSCITKIDNVAFWGAKSLESLTLSGTKWIGDEAFKGCTALESVTFPTTIVHIGDRAFSGCNNTAFKEVSFSGCTNLSYLGSSCFAECTYVAEINFTNCTSLASIPSSCFSGDTAVTKITFKGCTSLTTISDSAFANLTKLESVSLNSCKALTTIGSSAFSGDTSLKYVNLSGCTKLTTISDYCFKGTALTNIYSASSDSTNKSGLILSGCTGGTSGKITIGNNCFENCTALTTVDLSSSVVSSIGNSAFKSCTSLTTVKYAPNTTTVSDSCFESCSKLSSFDFVSHTNITSFGSRAFYGTALQYANINGFSNLTSIGESCFNSCTSLKTINIQNNPNLTSLGASCFMGCSSLTTVDLSGDSGLTSIGNSCFSSCSKFTTLTLGSCTSLSTLGDSAFTGCSSLVTLDLSSCTGLTSIGTSCFGGVTSLTTIILTNCTSLTTINAYAFNWCSGLYRTTSTDNSFVLPNSVTTLGTYAFAYCTSLTSFVMDYSSSKLTSIPSYCFSGDTALVSSVTNQTIGSTAIFKLPNSVTTIDTYAFNGCTAIKYMYIGTNLTSMNAFAFYGDTSLALVFQMEFGSYTSYYPIAGKYVVDSVYVDSAKTTKVKMYFYHGKSKVTLTSAELSNISNGYLTGYWYGSHSSITLQTS